MKILGKHRCFDGTVGYYSHAAESTDCTMRFAAFVPRGEGVPDDPAYDMGQGAGDEFLEEQLLPGRFADACAAAKQGLRLRQHPGYDHSYFFIASFIDDHIRHHADVLV